MEFLKYFSLLLVAFSWNSGTTMESDPTVADNNSDGGSGPDNNEDIDQMNTNKISTSATDRNIVEDLEQRVHELDCKLRQVSTEHL